jgi:hypothetical protein
MVGLVRSTRYVLALASPAPPAPLPRSGSSNRPTVKLHRTIIAAVRVPGTGSSTRSMHDRRKMGSVGEIFLCS